MGKGKPLCPSVTTPGVSVKASAPPCLGSGGTRCSHRSVWVTVAVSRLSAQNPCVDFRFWKERWGVLVPRRNRGAKKKEKDHGGLGRREPNKTFRLLLENLWWKFWFELLVALHLRFFCKLWCQLVVYLAGLVIFCSGQCSRGGPGFVAWAGQSPMLSRVNIFTACLGYRFTYHD